MRAETRKFGLADKMSELPPVAVEALRAIGQPCRDLVFPWPKCESELWTQYGKILKRAGLTRDRKSKFHRMRRSAASHYEAAGGNATELCGHSTRRVTRAYLDPRIATVVQPARLLFTPGESEGAA